MELPRRQFSTEFKLAAIRRLEQGVSVAEVARALEVNPTCENGGAKMDHRAAFRSRLRAAEN